LSSTWKDLPLSAVRIEMLEAERHKGPFLGILVFAMEIHHYFGLTDTAIQPGDNICALLGGNVPHILRKYRDSWVVVGQW
jgi:hypothetical protein